MKFHTLEEQIKILKEISRVGDLDVMEVVIPLHEESVGKTAHVYVTSISKGFDWDKNLIFVNPKKPLQYADRHELYQKNIDTINKYKDKPEALKYYNDAQNSLRKHAKKLLNKTDIDKLTSQQLKDLIKLLEFEGK